MSKRVFVAYAREDQDRVRRLVSVMEREGLNPRWDEDFESAQAWRDSRDREIAEADEFVWMLSVASSKSGEVRREYDFARGQGKRCHFILIDTLQPGDVDDDVANAQWIDATSEARWLRALKQRAFPRTRTVLITGAVGLVTLLGVLMAGPFGEDEPASERGAPDPTHFTEFTGPWTVVSSESGLWQAWTAVPPPPEADMGLIVTVTSLRENAPLGTCQLVATDRDALVPEEIARWRSEDEISPRTRVARITRFTPARAWRLIVRVETEQGQDAVPSVKAEFAWMPGR